MMRSASCNRAALPSATRVESLRIPRIAILGDGQLARMMTQEGRRLGMKVSCVGSSWNSSLRTLCNEWFERDAPGVEAHVATTHDAIVIENDHIDPATLRAIEAAGGRIHPRPESLALIQDRLTQRRWLEQRCIPQAEFRVPADDGGDLPALLSELGGRAVVKTRRGGYDGRGQQVVDGLARMAEAQALAASAPTIVERFIPFEHEISVVVGRSVSGTTACYPTLQNVHYRHALLASVAPARVDPAVVSKATEIATRIANELEYVGVMAVEFFVLARGKVLVNEIALRVHNTGHLTWGACVSSQFEQHMRLAAGWEPADVTPLTPAVMLNLFGDSWDHPAVDWSAIQSAPSARLFLYEKEARPGRKIGHILFMGESTEAAIRNARELFVRSGLSQSLPGALERFDAALLKAAESPLALTDRAVPDVRRGFST